MHNLKQELLQCNQPLRMTEEMRRIEELPSPPPFLPETPPAHLFPWFARDAPSPGSPATPTPQRMRGPDPWNGPGEVGGITPLNRAAAPGGQGGTVGRDTAAAAAGPHTTRRGAGATGPSATAAAIARNVTAVVPGPTRVLRLGLHLRRTILGE